MPRKWKLAAARKVPDGIKLPVVTKPPEPQGVEADYLTACVHRGGKLRSLGCNTCGNRDGKQDVFACEVFGECTLRRHNTNPLAEPRHHCFLCPKAKPPMLTFDRVQCVSLDRRPDRWQRFLEGLPAIRPFGDVERFSAIDGKLCPAPAWWKQGNGAWGCYRSHVTILERALNDGVNTLLVFEDDATFCEGFADRFKIFHESMPMDWGMAYLGGQHLMERQNPPIRINSEVVKPFNVNRTHAMLFRGRDVMLAVYQHISAIDTWRRGHHIDHHLGQLISKRKLPVYAPTEWLVGQNDSKSDINGKTPAVPERFWNVHAAAKAHAKASPFVVVLGLHRSGSSALAGVLHRLGVDMGKHFKGAEPGGGHEDGELGKLCERLWRFPAIPTKLNPRVFQAVKRYIGTRSGAIVGAKYPHMCALAPAFAHALGDRMRVIVADRPLQESIDSLILREQGKKQRDPETLAKLQTVLWNRRNEFLATRTHFLVNYADMLTDPTWHIDAISNFLEISPTDEQRANARAWIRPELRRIGKISLDTPEPVG